DPTHRRSSRCVLYCRRQIADRHAIRESGVSDRIGNCVHSTVSYSQGTETNSRSGRRHCSPASGSAPLSSNRLEPTAECCEGYTETRKYPCHLETRSQHR